MITITLIARSFYNESYMTMRDRRLNKADGIEIKEHVQDQ